MQFIIATGNAHKLLELERTLAPLGIDAVSTKAKGISLDDVEETGTTFEENAYLKAKAACDKTGLPAVADDSGLCVEVLSGAPGIYSARWAGEGATQDELIAKLHSELSGKENKKAKFVSVIALAFSEDDIVIAEGECQGEIIDDKRGAGGFGYDPVFYVPSLGKTFSELSVEDKNKISHRANALKAFAEVLQEKRNDK